VVYWGVVSFREGIHAINFRGCGIYFIVRLDGNLRPVDFDGNLTMAYYLWVSLLPRPKVT